MTPRPTVAESLAAQHRVMTMDVQSCTFGCSIAHTDGHHWQLASDQSSPMFAPAVFRSPQAAFGATQMAKEVTEAFFARASKAVRS